MKYTILKGNLIIVGMLTVLFASGQAHSTQWPFPHEAYPKDVIYYSYLLQGTAEDSRFNNAEKILDVRSIEVEGSQNQPETDRAGSKHQHQTDYETYGYCAP